MLVITRTPNTYNITTDLYLDVKDYGGLSTALADPALASKNLCVSDSQTLTGNANISGRRLVVLLGGMIVKASTYTFTVASDGIFEAGDFQVFSGFSAGDITGLTFANLEWFGFSSSASSTVNDAAISCAAAAVKRVYLPSGTFDIDVIPEITTTVELIGNGLKATILHPVGNGGTNLTLSGVHSVVRDLSFVRDTDYEDTGTALNLQNYGIQVENVEFVHMDKGIHASDKFYYHKYTNVYHRNGSDFLADATDNNDNLFLFCEFQDQFDMTGGNNVAFVGCDFSTNTAIGDSPFTFTDPVAIIFDGLYTECVDTGASGPFDLFNFVEVTTTSPPKRSITINNVWAKGISGEYDSLFMFDGTHGSIRGGYVNAFTNVAKTANGGDVMIYSLQKQNSVAYFPAASSGSYIDHGTVRLGTTVGTPIASDVVGVAISNAKMEASGKGQATSTSVLNTSKDAAAGSTSHYGIYSGTSLVGSVSVENNAQVQLNAPTSGGRVELRADTGASLQRLDIYAANVVPNNDNVATLGKTGQRFKEVWAANGTIQTSDARLKKDVLTVADGLDIIKQIRPVTYRSTERDDGLHYGVIAQEIEQLLPNDAALVKKPTGEGQYYGVQYSELIPLLIAAIQEQQRQIEELRGK